MGSSPEEAREGTGSRAGTGRSSGYVWYRWKGQISGAADSLGSKMVLHLRNEECRQHRPLEQGRQSVSFGHLNLRAQKDARGEPSVKAAGCARWGIKRSRVGRRYGSGSQPVG